MDATKIYIIQPCQKAIPNLKSLTKFNLFTATIHFGIACFFMYLVIKTEDSITLMANREALVMIATCWNVSRTDKNETHFDIKNKWVDTAGTRKSTITTCIIIFHLLSAAFQGVPWLLYWFKFPPFVKYFNNVICNNGTQVLRYTEYTLSAPLMIVAIGLSFGILDVYTLAGLGALTALCMQLGLAADVFRVSARDTCAITSIFMTLGAASDEVRFQMTCIAQEMKINLKRYMYLFHAASWVAIILPWFVIIKVFVDLSNQTYSNECSTPDSTTEMPAAIIFIVFGEAILFAAFGFVQVCQIWYFDDSSLKFGTRVEWVFISLSLVSKTALGLAIYSSSIFT